MGEAEREPQRLARTKSRAASLSIASNTTLEQAHRLCDHLEGGIKGKLPGAVITIHCEPPEAG